MKTEVELRGITHRVTRQKTSFSFSQLDALFFSTFENTLHSLHECYNSLIFSTSQCNDKQKEMSLMSPLKFGSDISDMRKTSSCHLGTLIFSGL